ncbi:leucine-rich repeat domain-containing protein [Flavivirga amylovorans]|uniref:Leucine-rich repeat domain-containing protein n=1 Tax=Flavivirga amylovorans TaxID=870486 RepID=A0ABT8X0L4_9FLAO|nr:leucine-rich repeat domain-containing protein [Flavivirga amylovorans]MDO5987491.1 leucine-rich repeat domain-containing protein [Flavivirga amylovorans]
MKKQLQLKWSFAILFIVLTVTTYGQNNLGNTFTVDGLEYKITSLSPNTVKTTDYMGTTTEVTIPETVQDYTVTVIGNDAFKEKGLTSVTLPNSIINIRDWAFSTNNLTEVIIPGSVTHIGSYAFVVNQLDSIVIPNSVTNIWECFFSNNRLTSVTSIGSYAFLDNQLTEVTIPNSVVYIWDWAFWNNSGLATVVAEGTIPPSLREDAFAPAHNNKGNAGNIVTVYPNPAQDNIHITLSDGEALQQVNLYNTLGRHVYSANALQIDISHLPGGMYMLEIETKAGEKVVKRVIIK